MRDTHIQTAAFDVWSGKKLRHLEAILDQHLPSPEIKPERLHEAMRYSTLEGGKRVRALLVYAAAEFCGADIERADIPAAAVELIHAFSLVHDDLPCMDNDDMRRGKPSTHKQYGDAMALLVGDALQSLAFQLISQDSHLKGPQKVKMLHVLSLASGSRGMAGGQAIDLESMGIPLTQEELETMHIHKTGALIRASALLGAYCAVRPNEDKLKAVDHFAKAIGLAFQVVDDILDTESDSQTLGKTAGKDAQANKSTYVTILGISRAKELAEELHANAMAALSFFGREADLLRHLGNFVMRRNH